MDRYPSCMIPAHNGRWCFQPIFKRTGREAERSSGVRVAGTEKFDTIGRLAGWAIFRPPETPVVKQAASTRTVASLLGSTPLPAITGMDLAFSTTKSLTDSFSSKYEFMHNRANHVKCFPKQLRDQASTLSLRSTLARIKEVVVRQPEHAAPPNHSFSHLVALLQEICSH